MRRTLLLLAALALTLVACGSTDTTVAPPPNATQIDSVETIDNAQIGIIISEWKNAAPAQMKADAVKPETIEERVYTVPGSLSDIQSHYNTLTTKGWYSVKKMTNAQNDQVLLLGFEHGTTALVVGAIDATKFGGAGVVVYTLKGTK